MTTPENESHRPVPGPDASIADVEADIARTRGELAETVDALTDKLDVKSQAQRKAHEVTQRASDQLHTAQAQGGALLDQARDSATDVQGNIRPVVPVVAISLVAVVIFILWRRRR